MTKITQAVILAGGRGERLLPLTLEVPKPMLVFHGKPFLEYIVEQLVSQGITDITLLLGYLSEKVIDYFGDGAKWGVRIQYSVTDISDDTGARVRKAAHYYDQHFLLMYCDNYWPLNLKELEVFYSKMGTRASVTVYSNTDNFTKNNTLVTSDGLVRMYDKKRLSKDLNGVEIGFYILEKSVVDLLGSENVNFEKEILPQLIEENQLSGFLTDKPYYSVSTLERLSRTDEYLASITEHVQ